MRAPSDTLFLNGGEPIYEEPFCVRLPDSGIHDIDLCVCFEIRDYTGFPG